MHDSLAKPFEENRTHLRAVAYRMLGSLGDAEDAVQEAWLRLSNADAGSIGNLRSWLTTVVARVCLDMLRSRNARREEPVASVPDRPDGAVDAESEAVLADSVGLALLVVLDTLAPAERLAFVLHDMFAVPFEEIAPIVGRSPAAARQLASRARRRLQGAPAVSEADLVTQREVVGAFLAAVRAGDFDALVAVLDPDVEVRADRSAVPKGTPTEYRGAAEVARRAIAGARGARFGRMALIDGVPGLVVAPRGRLYRVLRFTIEQGRITGLEVLGDADKLRRLDLAVLD